MVAFSIFFKSEMSEMIKSMKLCFKGCGMGALFVLVSPCFRENVVVTCKLGLFCVV